MCLSVEEQLSHLTIPHTTRSLALRKTINIIENLKVESAIHIQCPFFFKFVGYLLNKKIHS